MTAAAQVTQLLGEMKQLNDRGELKLLDSLTLIDLVARLENLFQVSIPLPLAFKTFNSKPAIVDLINKVIEQNNQINHKNVGAERMETLK